MDYHLLSRYKNGSHYKASKLIPCILIVCMLIETRRRGRQNNNRPINLPNVVTAVSNRWTGLLEWTTGMDFDLFFLFFSQELIEELV